MKKLAIALLVVACVASFASAEVLQTAMTQGQGVWGGLLGYTTTSNYFGESGASIVGFGGYIAYGLTNNIDLQLKLGSGTSSGLTYLTLADAETLTQLGLIVKYGICKESDSMPVSVAASVGYQSDSFSDTVTGFPASTSTASEVGVGVGVSKVMAPCIPYAAISYKSISPSAGASSTEMDLTVGTAVAWSRTGAVFLEGTSAQITSGGASVTQTQLALGIGMSR